MYRCQSKCFEKCFVFLAVFLPFVFCFIFFSEVADLSPVIVLRGYYLQIKLLFLHFLSHIFVQLQKIVKLLVSFLCCVFAHRKYCLHNHGFEMEYSDLKLLCINDARDSFRIVRIVSSEKHRSCK